MRGRDWLMASAICGTGMRLMVCVQRLVQDLDFGYRQITAHVLQRGTGAVGSPVNVLLAPAP